MGGAARAARATALRKSRARDPALQPGTPTPTTCRAPHRSATAPRHKGLPGADSECPQLHSHPSHSHGHITDSQRRPPEALGWTSHCPLTTGCPRGEVSDWAGQSRGCARCWGCPGNHTDFWKAPHTLGHATSHWTGVGLGGCVPGEPSSAGRRGGCPGLKITRSSPLTGRGAGVRAGARATCLPPPRVLPESAARARVTPTPPTEPGLYALLISPPKLFPGMAFREQKRGWGLPSDPHTAGSGAASQEKAH